MSSNGLFGRERIVDLLIELGSRLDRRGIHAELFVVGGGRWRSPTVANG